MSCLMEVCLLIQCWVILYYIVRLNSFVFVLSRTERGRKMGRVGGGGGSSGPGSPPMGGG